MKESAELIEHWWRTGMTRQDVYVRQTRSGTFEVEHRLGDKSTTREYETMTQASLIAEALRAGQDGWRKTHIRNR